MNIVESSARVGWWIAAAAALLIGVGLAVRTAHLLVVGQRATGVIELWGTAAEFLALAATLAFIAHRGLPDWSWREDT